MKTLQRIQLRQLAARSTATLHELRQPYDEEQPSALGGAVKTGAMAVGAAGLIGGGAIGYQKYKDRVSGLRSTQPGFAQKSAGGQAWGAAQSLGGDAVAKGRGWLKSGANKTAGALGGSKVGWLQRAGKTVAKWATHLEASPLDGLRELAARSEAIHEFVSASGSEKKKNQQPENNMRRAIGTAFIPNISNLGTVPGTIVNAGKYQEAGEVYRKRDAYVDHAVGGIAALPGAAATLAAPRIRRPGVAAAVGAGGVVAGLAGGYLGSRWHGERELNKRKTASRIAAIKPATATA